MKCDSMQALEPLDTDIDAAPTRLACDAILVHRQILQRHAILYCRWYRIVYLSSVIIDSSEIESISIAIFML